MYTKLISFDVKLQALLHAARTYLKGKVSEIYIPLGPSTHLNILSYFGYEILLNSVLANISPNIIIPLQSS